MIGEREGNRRANGGIKIGRKNETEVREKSIANEERLKDKKGGRQRTNNTEMEVGKRS